MTLLLALLPCAARAVVDGEPFAPLASLRVAGGVVVTGNTLMSQSVIAPQVNSALLRSSAGDLRGTPADAELEAAWLYWSGSIEGAPDRTADLTAADGAFFDDIAADRCLTVNRLGGFFACRADVTARLRDHAGNQAWSGTYRVGDVTAQPGIVGRNGQCRDPNCQAKYAAWSLVLVYRSQSAPRVHDVLVHDGFRFFDEDQNSPGIDRFVIGGFDFPAGGQARLTLFGLEGDSFLGVPPQDTDPFVPCDDCFDFMEFAGTRLGDALNPPGNLFNSSSPGGFTLGLDLDTFDVSNLLRAGDRQAEIVVGSGDGNVDPDAPGGAGEAFLLGFVVLDIERDAAPADISGPETNKIAVDLNAGPLEP
ncbi:MAG: hypothetical protein KC620_08865, partial [Myxococcales bacterium]|nr:hypothetical protein [Myxococcales bacterium]